LTRVLNDAPPALKEAILGAIAEAYRRIEGPEGIVVQGAFWIVSARP
jgi:hypothetical protein